MVPWLAEKWSTTNAGRSVRIALRPNIVFHDGTPLNAAAVAGILPELLRSFMGPVYADVESVKAIDPQTVEIAFSHASPLLYESLEVVLRKPEPTVIGTCAFAVVGGSATDMTANASYYL